MSHNTDARDEIVRRANAVLATLTTAMPGGGAMREHLAEIIAEAESMTLDDPPTYDGQPVYGDPEPEMRSTLSPREQMRRACIDLTRLADALGWEWSIEACESGGGRWVYRIEVDGRREGDG